MNIKKKTKKELCDSLEQTYSIIRRNRDINILEYDINGYVVSYSVKLGSCYFAFSWLSDTIGYKINNHLTSRLNKIYN